MLIRATVTTALGSAQTSEAFGLGATGSPSRLMVMVRAPAALQMTTVITPSLPMLGMKPTGSKLRNVSAKTSRLYRTLRTGKRSPVLALRRAPPNQTIRRPQFLATRCMTGATLQRWALRPQRTRASGNSVPGSPVSCRALSKATLRT